MIWRNFWRDLRHSAARLVSVTIITAIAVGVYTGLSGISYNVDRISQRYFGEQNAASYWITGVGLDEGDCRAIGKLPGVRAVQPRLVCDAEERGNGAVTVELCAVPAGFTLNTPLLLEGRFPEDSRGLLLSDRFAAARGLSVGDFYDLSVKGGDYRLRLPITGLIKDPEYLYPVSAVTPSPDFSRHGFAYLELGALEGLYGPHSYNQICVQTEGTADAAFRRAVSGVLGDKVVNILALEDNIRAYNFVETRDNIEVILRVFPILFFLCAVLLMVSTMDRLVESARSTVGTFKALGYCDAAIMCCYLLYALLVAVAGSILGAAGGALITGFLVDIVALGCDLPPYAAAVDFRACGEAFLITAICCLGSAFLVCRSLLREDPAQCMRPKPPKSAKPVLLERISPLWRRLGFSQKYIVRSTLRSKARMLTCITGIAFCMALVFLAFALRDSLAHYSAALTQNQHRYDLMADLSQGVTGRQYRRLLDCADTVELEMGTACWLYAPSRLTTAALTVAEDVADLKRYDPYAAAPLSLPPDGLVLEKRVAEDLGVEAGDVIRLKLTGNPRYYAVKIAGLSRHVSGACVSRSFWRSLGLPYTPTAAYFKGDAQVQKLERCDFIDGIQSREAVTGAMVERMSSASMVVYVLILLGGALACVVIYNLGVMSFFEQIRSLATLMVLGFYDREIKRLQLSENLIFAAAGIILGIPLGMAIDRRLVDSITTLPLEAATRPASFLLSGAVTMLFALAVNLVIGRRMRGIDMLGALKSIE